MSLDAHVDDVRAFGRFYTQRIGVVSDRVYASDWTLTEARLIFELGQHPEVEVTDLRRVLALDPGYLSRLLVKLERAGLVGRRRSASDGRRQTAWLTEAGRREFTRLNERSAADVRELLEPVPAPARASLTAAMRRVRAILEGGETSIRQGLEPGDRGWIVEANAVAYARQFGWNTDYERLVATIVAEFEHRPREAAWIATVGGERAGCVMCVREDDATARLRLLFVEPWARNRGLGDELVTTCLDFARAEGYERVVLWTNDVLASARRIYERHGFTLVEEEPHHSFGHDLVSQTWSRPLRG